MISCQSGWLATGTTDSAFAEPVSVCPTATPILRKPKSNATIVPFGLVFSSGMPADPVQVADADAQFAECFFPTLWQGRFKQNDFICRY